MSATVNDKRRRNDTNNQTPLQPTNASVGGAAAARMQGYSSPWLDGSGNVLSAMHDASGVRKDFINGLSPEDANTQRVRAQMATQGTATAAPTTNPAPIVGNRPTAAAVALDRPTDASVALNRPTDASVALNGPAGAPAASRGPLYDPRNPPQTMRLAGTAADASSAMKQVAQNPGAFTGTTGYGKLGQVAAPAPANTNLTGTSAVPYTDPATGKTQVGFVTVGNPNAPDPLAGAGGTGAVRDGIPMQKDARGNFVPAVAGPPLPPPKALDLPSSPGASGPTYDPANPPSLDKTSQQAIVAQYPEVGNAGSWANTAFKAGLKPGQNTAADAQNTLDRLTKPDPASPSLAQYGVYGSTLQAATGGTPTAPTTNGTQPPKAPAGNNLAYTPPAGPPEMPTPPLAPGVAAGQAARSAVGNLVQGSGNALNSAGSAVSGAVGTGINAVRGFLGYTTPSAPASPADSSPTANMYAKSMAVGAATTGAPGPATDTANNANLGSPDTGFQRTAASSLATAPTAADALNKAPTAASTLASAPTASSALSSAPTASNTLAAAPTAADALNRAPNAAGTLKTAPSADDVLAKAPTAGTTLGNAPTAANALAKAPTAATTLAGAPTAGDALAGAPSAADSLNAASLYHPAKFSGDPAAATNPFGTAQPLTLGSTVSTDGMYHGGFPGVGGAPANPLGGNAAAPMTLDPDELLRRKAAMLPAGTTGSFSNAPKTS